ncbi:MAG: hypothetical protein N3B21_07525 [Clostridia bacterium]|nr:hypothetical protein [Clostridia bacterium]
MMIYTTADTNPCIPIDNLSTVHKHYETCTNLCLTSKDTLETCCNLSTATDLQHVNITIQKLYKASDNSRQPLLACGTPDNLSSNIIYPF